MRTHSRPFRLTAVTVATGLVLAQITPLPAAAQAPPLRPPPGVQDPQASGDPPARVGRLARVSGTVSFHTQDDTQWSPATVNYPVTAGNAFWTEPNAQAEIEVSASRIALAPGTELDIAALDDTNFLATEPQGEIYLRIATVAPDESYAVQTPRGLVSLAGTGRYEVAAGDTQNPTLVTVLEGAAQVTGPGVSLQVGPNQTATISGTDSFEGDIGPAQRDAFLAAMLDRERPPPVQAVAPPPVVAAMPGGEDLSAYGAWSDSPDYGQVWYPQVAPDWVPYRDGRWAYVAPWGWTWVDDAPWGFAPFHYGRWVQLGGRWGWYPGGGREPGRYPVYAPALVTFFGVGAAVGVGVGAALAAGRMGWLPLGPREEYRPWYHASDRYVRQVNAAHVTNITTINRNVTINNFVNRGAATVVPAGAMTASRPIRAVAQRVDPGQLAQARPVFGQQPLRPTTTTVGVTPGVAHQLNLTPVPGAVVPHAVAPGPAIRPAGVVPGAAALRPPPPALQNPAGPAPAAARPFGSQPPLATPGARPGLPQGTPLLREPAAPGQAGPPPIRHEPAVVGPGLVQRPAPGPAPGVGNPPPPLRPGGEPGVNPLARPGPQVTNPALVHPTPGPAVQTPPPLRPGGEPGMNQLGRPGPQITNPALVRPAPGPAVQTPPPLRPGGEPGVNPLARPGPQVTNPALVRPTPGPAVQTPPPLRPGGEPGMNQLGRPGPQITNPTLVHPAPGPAVQTPPPAFRAPPPAVQAPPPALQPAPAFRAPPPAPAPAFHPPPPPPQVHVAAPPPPPPQVHVAPPPAPAFHPPPPPPAAPAFHPPPPPPPAAPAFRPPPPAPAQSQQHPKRPGEP